MERRAPAKVPEHSEDHERRSNHNRHDLADAGQIYLARRSFSGEKRADPGSDYN